MRLAIVAQTGSATFWSVKLSKPAECGSEFHPDWFIVGFEKRIAKAAGAAHMPETSGMPWSDMTMVTWRHVSGPEGPKSQSPSAERRPA